jgi:hypothetical protein
VSLSLWVGSRETGRPLSPSRLNWHAGGVEDVRTLTGLFSDHGGSLEASTVSRALMRQAPGDRRLDDLRTLVREAIDLGGCVCYG